MPDTIFYVMAGEGTLINDFGSAYPTVLAILQQTTREQGDALMQRGASPLEIQTAKGIALFKSRIGAAYNPKTDVKEYGVHYLGLRQESPLAEQLGISKEQAPAFGAVVEEVVRVSGGLRNITDDV